MLKEIKDLKKNVRMSSEALVDIQSMGWSPQMALDFAIREIREKGIKAPEKKK